MERVRDKKESDKKQQDDLDLSEKVENMSSDGESCACVTSCRYKETMFRSNAIYQDNVIYSTCLFVTFFITGWGKSMFGPAYIDLRLISGTDLKQGSWILTSLFIGYAIGSTFQGVIYNRVNRKLMFSACLLIWSGTMASIPWCSQFEAMLIGYILIGALQSILEAGGLAELLQIWESKGRVAILRSNLLYASGSVVGPLVVAPFLMDRKQGNITSTGPNSKEMNPMNLSFNGFEIFIQTQNSSDYNVTSTIRNISDDPFLVPDDLQYNSELYIPFSLISGLSFVCCIMFLISNAMHSKERTEEKKAKVRKERNLPFFIKAFSLSTIGGMLFFFGAIEDAYTAFLATFCVEYFHWSKQDGAFLTSLVFILVLVARVLTILIERWVNTLVFIGVYLILMFLSLLGLFIISWYDVGDAIWFLAPMFGFSKSCLFVLFLSWSNEYIIPITGGLSACYFVSSTLGSAINPVLLGYLMEDQPVWFCYLFLIEIVIVLVLFVVGSLATKYVGRNHGYTFDKESNIMDKKDTSENEEFIHRNIAIQPS